MLLLTDDLLVTVGGSHPSTALALVRLWSSVDRPPSGFAAPSLGVQVSQGFIHRWEKEEAGDGCGRELNVKVWI